MTIEGTRNSAAAFGGPLDDDRALEVAARAVAGCPADAVEVTVLGRSGEYTRFAGDRIHQPQDITELTVMVTAIVNGHSARAATSRLDRVAETASAARLWFAAGPLKPEWAVTPRWGSRFGAHIGSLAFRHRSVRRRCAGRTRRTGHA